MSSQTNNSSPAADKVKSERMVPYPVQCYSHFELVLSCIADRSILPDRVWSDEVYELFLYCYDLKKEDYPEHIFESILSGAIYGGLLKISERWYSKKYKMRYMGIRLPHGSDLLDLLALVSKFIPAPVRPETGKVASPFLTAIEQSKRQFDENSVINLRKRTLYRGVQCR